jgi:hypothetical protein
MSLIRTKIEQQMKKLLENDALLNDWNGGVVFFMWIF